MATIRCSFLVVLLSLATAFAQGQTFKSLDLDMTRVTGGGGSIGEVFLSSPAPTGGVTIDLASGDAAVAGVPASVSVSAGRTSAKFSITTVPVLGESPVQITGTDGATVHAATLYIEPPLLHTIYFASATGSTTGTVALDGPAPAGGLVVTLLSSSAQVSIPASVTIPANSTSATFPATISTVEAASYVTVTGILHFGFKDVTLELLPPDFADPGFEQPAIAPGSYEAAPTGTSWTYNNPTASQRAGIANGSGSWGTGAHSGAQYAFVQQGSSVQQTISGLIVGHKYEVQFWMAVRDGDVGANSPAAMVVTANGTTILGPTTPSSFSWVQYTTGTFTASSSSCTFVFTSQQSSTDCSDLLDDVHLVRL